MFEFALPEKLFKFQYEIPAFESLVQLPPNIASAHRIAHFYIIFILIFVKLSAMKLFGGDIPQTPLVRELF